MINLTLKDLYYQDEKFFNTGLKKLIDDYHITSPENLDKDAESELRKINLSTDMILKYYITETEPRYKLFVGKYEVLVYGKEELCFILINNADFDYIKDGGNDYFQYCASYLEIFRIKP